MAKKDNDDWYLPILSLFLPNAGKNLLLFLLAEELDTSAFALAFGFTVLAALAAFDGASFLFSGTVDFGFLVVDFFNPADCSNDCFDIAWNWLWLCQVYDYVYVYVYLYGYNVLNEYANANGWLLENCEYWERKEIRWDWLPSNYLIIIIIIIIRRIWCDEQSCFSAF